MVMKATAKKSVTRTIPAGEFKAKCLQLMDEVHESKLTVIVTKRGKPVAQLSAPAVPESNAFRSIFGRTPGVKIPTEAEWKKLKAAFATLKSWRAPSGKAATRSYGQASIGCEWISARYARLAMGPARRYAMVFTRSHAGDGKTPASQ
jgi:antitoxin (DNA-binding transcriptional repressor) of toxin-antitoxin stability system